MDEDLTTTSVAAVDKSLWLLRRTQVKIGMNEVVERYVVKLLLPRLGVHQFLFVCERTPPPW